METTKYELVVRNRDYYETDWTVLFAETWNADKLDNYLQSIEELTWTRDTSIRGDAYHWESKTNNQMYVNADRSEVLNVCFWPAS